MSDLPVTPAGGVRNEGASLGLVLVCESTCAGWMKCQPPSVVKASVCGGTSVLGFVRSSVFTA